MQLYSVSDLIEIGCKLHPRQSFHVGFESTIDSKRTKACVRGAVHAGLAHLRNEHLTFNESGYCIELHDNGHPLNIAISDVKVRKGDVTEKMVQDKGSEEKGWDPMPLKRMMTYLNDNREWSRLRIADWIQENHLDVTIYEASEDSISLEAPTVPF